MARRSIRKTEDRQYWEETYGLSRSVFSYFQAFSTFFVAHDTFVSQKPSITTVEGRYNLIKISFSKNASPKPYIQGRKRLLLGIPSRVRIHLRVQRSCRTLVELV